MTASRLIRLLGFAVLVLVVAAGSRLYASGPVLSHAQITADDPLGRIDAAFREGLLPREEHLLLQLTAIKKPERLPESFRGDWTPAKRLPDRCVTPILLEIINALPSLSPAGQSEAAAILTRQTTEFTLVSPGGFFLLHYDTSGFDAVPLADADFDSIPDFVEACAAYCDSSLVQQQQAGYLLPPSDGGLGGDTLFDVYFEEMSFYGYAQPEGSGPNSWNDRYSHLVLNSTFIGFPPNNDPEGDIAGAAKATVGHEFHHCIQFAYDVSEPGWFLELDATWTEDQTFDLVDDNYNYLDEFFTTPELALSTSTIRQYAAFVWAMYLSEQFDTTLLRSAWEGARFSTILSTINDTLLARYGWTQDSAYADFARWCYMTSTRDNGVSFEEANVYPLVTIARSHGSLPVASQASAKNPAGYGAVYTQFTVGGSAGNYYFTVDGDDSRQWKGWVIATSGTNTHTFFHLDCADADRIDTVQVDSIEQYQTITLVMVNVTELSSAAAFTYAASEKTIYNFTTDMLDSVVYAGSTRNLQVEVANESIAGDVIRAVFDDSLGWVTKDSMDIFVPASSNGFIAVPIAAQAGVPLGTTTSVRVLSRSLNDPLVTQSIQTPVSTVLYHGDVDFSGQIDIADLTYLVAYLFIDGPSPIPVVESADANCMIPVDIDDLVTLVDFLFVSQAPIPCNPY